MSLTGMSAIIICAILSSGTPDSLELEKEDSRTDSIINSVVRISLQTGTGILTGGLCGALGWIGCGYIGYLMGHDPPILEAGIGAYAGFTLGSPLGIWGVGKADGVEGSFKETLLGSLKGSAVGATILIAANVLSIDAIRSRWELPVVSSLIGGLFGFYKSVK